MAVGSCQSVRKVDKVRRGKKRREGEEESEVSKKTRECVKADSERRLDKARDPSTEKQSILID